MTEEMAEPKVTQVQDSSQPPHSAEDATLTAVREMFAGFGKIVSPRGIDQAKYVTLGAARQWVTIRGQDRALPILLYLHGGPGGAISDLSYIFQRPWEDYFTVVHWDQRGFGRSAIEGARLEGSLNLEQYVADAIELIELLCRELGQSKVVLLGQSWGSVLAVEVAHRRPDLVFAVTTAGQVVDERLNFEETRLLLIDAAKARGDLAVAESLTALGPAPVLQDYDAWLAWMPAVGMEMEGRGYSCRNAQTMGRSWSERMGAVALVSPSMVDPIPQPEVPFAGGIAAAMREINVNISNWRAYDAVGTRFQVPFIMISGTYDYQTPITLARAYFEAIEAPYKVFVEFPNSAHVVLLEEPGRMLVTLVEQVLPATRGQIPAGAITYLKDQYESQG